MPRRGARPLQTLLAPMQARRSMSASAPRCDVAGQAAAGPHANCRCARCGAAQGLTVGSIEA
jgi:hypothetical protein